NRNLRQNLIAIANRCPSTDQVRGHASLEAALVRIDAKPQRLRTDERHEIALPLPGAGFRQRRNQLVIGLRPVRRTGPVFHRAGDEDHGVARHRKLALAALAPEFEDDLAAVADFQVRYSLGSRLTPGIQRHFRSKRKAVIGESRTDNKSSHEQSQRNSNLLPKACGHTTSRTIWSAVLLDEDEIDQTV